MDFCLRIQRFLLSSVSSLTFRHQRLTHRPKRLDHPSPGWALRVGEKKKCCEFSGKAKMELFYNSHFRGLKPLKAPLWCALEARRWDLILSHFANSGNTPGRATLQGWFKEQRYSFFTSPDTLNHFNGHMISPDFLWPWSRTLSPRNARHERLLRRNGSSELACN